METRRVGLGLAGCARGGERGLAGPRAPTRIEAWGDSDRDVRRAADEASICKSRQRASAWTGDGGSGVTRMVGRGRPLSANCPGSLFAAASEMLRYIYIYHSPVASRAERPGPAAQIVAPPASRARSGEGSAASAGADRACGLGT